MEIFLKNVSKNFKRKLKKKNRWRSKRHQKNRVVKLTGISTKHFQILDLFLQLILQVSMSCCRGTFHAYHLFNGAKKFFVHQTFGTQFAVMDLACHYTFVQSTLFLSYQMEESRCCQHMNSRSCCQFGGTQRHAPALVVGRGRLWIRIRNLCV
jgi:hypothetical protein